MEAVAGVPELVLAAYVSRDTTVLGKHIDIARGVDVFDRVVSHVGVPVEGLGVGRVGDDGVGADEPGYLGVVVAGVVIEQPGLVVVWS